MANPKKVWRDDDGVVWENYYSAKVANRVIAKRKAIIAFVEEMDGIYCFNADQAERAQQMLTEWEERKMKK